MCPDPDFAADMYKSLNKSRDLLKQFVLSKGVAERFENWHNYQSGQFTLHSHPHLPVIIVQTSDKIDNGFLLGWPVSVRNGFINNGVTYTIFGENTGDSVASNTKINVEAIYNDLGGRWIYIHMVSGEERIYLDPCGSLAMVYSPKMKTVASTINLIPYKEGYVKNSENDPHDYDIIRLMNIPENDYCYPLGLTSRHDVKRLLPNHYLDLNSWEQNRHYPNKLLSQIDIEESVQTTIQYSRSIIEGLTTRWKLKANITAGRDTRTVLACLRPYLDQTKFFTNEGYAKTTQLDISVAKRIARKFKLNHEISHYRKASEKDLFLWQYRTGGCVAGNSWLWTKIVEDQTPNLCNLPGNGGEIGRGYYWKKDDHPGRRLSPVEIFSRLRFPTNNIILDVTTNWLDKLNIDDIFIILDIFYIEQEIGCWQAPGLYGQQWDAPTIFILNHRRIIESMLSLDHQVKMKKRFSDAVIRKEWPELLRYPYNQPLGIPLYKKKIKNMIKPNYWRRRFRIFNNYK